MPKASAVSTASSYPRVCVRIIGGVYHWLPVKAVAEAPSEAPRMGQTLEFLDPTPGWPEEWHELRCEALVERALELCRAQNKSVCVVFGPKDAVYLELNGRRKQSDEPPWGGVGIGGGVNSELRGEGVREPPPTTEQEREAWLDRCFPDRHEPIVEDEDEDDDDIELKPTPGGRVVCSGDLGGDVYFHEPFDPVGEVCNLLRFLGEEDEKKLDWPTLLEGLPMVRRLPQLEFPPLADLRTLEEVGPFYAETGEPLVDFPGRTFYQLLIEIPEEATEDVVEQFTELAGRLRPVLEEE